MDETIDWMVFKVHDKSFWSVHLIRKMIDTIGFWQRTSKTLDDLLKDETVDQKDLSLR